MCVKSSRRSVREEKNRLQTADNLCCHSSFGRSGSGIVNKRLNERVRDIGKAATIPTGMVISSCMDNIVYIDGIVILHHLSEAKAKCQGGRGVGNLWLAVVL